MADCGINVPCGMPSGADVFFGDRRGGRLSAWGYAGGLSVYDYVGGFLVREAVGE